MKNITIKDVAKEAHVSTATVSRVINGKAVHEELYQAVIDAAARLNYYPNSMARGLKQNHSNSIGFLTSNISNAFWSSLIHSISSFLQKNNYTLLVCSTESDNEIEKTQLRLFMEQKVDGIILNTTGGNDEIISDLSKKVPMVLVNRTIETDFSGDIISNDNVPDIFLLTNLLINNGHTQIALLNGDKHLSPAHERMHGFLYAMSKIQPDITEESPYIYHGNFFSSDSGEKGVEYFLNMSDPPTAIIALSDDLALGALRYFKKNNISIPNDISFCCYGKIPNNDLLSIDICQSYNTAEAFGLRISQLIMDRIKNPSSNNREIYSPASLYLGNSIKTIT